MKLMMMLLSTANELTPVPGHTWQVNIFTYMFFYRHMLRNCMHVHFLVMQLVSDVVLHFRCTGQRSQKIQRRSGAHIPSTSGDP